MQRLSPAEDSKVVWREGSTELGIKSLKLVIIKENIIIVVVMMMKINNTNRCKKTLPFMCQSTAKTFTYNISCHSYKNPGRSPICRKKRSGTLRS